MLHSARLPRVGVAALGAGVCSYASYAAVTWARYGHVDASRRPRDELLDRFMPDAEVDEYHCVRVHAPASVTYAAGRAMDIQASLPIKAIFAMRAVPAILTGRSVAMPMVKRQAERRARPGGDGAMAGAAA